MNWQLWALVALCIFIFIEGAVRALALSFKWLPVVLGVLLMIAGTFGAISLLAGK